ncbi:DNA processing protein [Taibaiella chishuiensis]|uniref:DNA processing protein n=2 Tax=Taibaiella chishuiensis TaxID=1434707 RepID=A0A2P8CST9_9BACT|nr:DNA processing protein [Taibaiella chishuiensis]
MYKDEICEGELYALMALTRTPFIGGRRARILLEHFGTAEAVFEASGRQLAAVAGWGEQRIQSLKSTADHRWIMNEMRFMQEHGVYPLPWSHSNFPRLLNACADAPVLLYYKGMLPTNTGKTVAVIGTRKNTDYGKKMAEDLVAALQEENVTIVSGLAFGIDIYAHKKALACNMPTIAVLAHGLDRIYPAAHKHAAAAMIQQGGLLTEYASGTLPDKQNFPMRNRIVAGMADVTVVVETGIKGGAMITAKLASGYNRDVAAFPGKITDARSGGCNELIRTHVAQLIGSAADLMELMNWKQDGPKKVVQPELFAGPAATVVEVLGEAGNVHIEQLLQRADIGNAALAAVLLDLELNGFIQALPGKCYRLR